MVRQKFDEIRRYLKKFDPSLQEEYCKRRIYLLGYLQPLSLCLRTPQKKTPLARYNWKKATKSA